MAIDNTSCIAAIEHLKEYVSRCFAKCTAKGSTFSGTRNLANLETAIGLIPQSGGGSGSAGSGGFDDGGEWGVISENVIGASFSGFTVTMPQDDPFAEEFTIDFGSVGVTWKSILCYSDTKDGHFSIQKLPGRKCIISAAVFYNAANMWGEAGGIFPSGRGTYRANYEIRGNTIHFTNAEYDGTSNGWDSYDEFSSLPNQVSNFVNTYFTDQYKLDKITVCV